MEKAQLRNKIKPEPLDRNWKKETARWLFLFSTIVCVVTLAISTGYSYFILPPLIAMYVELANSKTGFRNRQLQLFIFIEAAAILGTVG